MAGGADSTRRLPTVDRVFHHVPASQVKGHLFVLGMYVPFSSKLSVGYRRPSIFPRPVGCVNIELDNIHAVSFEVNRKED